ncbi:MAG: hypothetical protein LBL26_13915 [Peptococcaceae bacterium]|nr:hypothetical protein [Peptococcaceae bacterium]
MIRGTIHLVKMSCRAALPDTEDMLKIIIDIVLALSAMVEVLIKLYDRWKQRKKEDKPP